MTILGDKVGDHSIICGGGMFAVGNRGKQHRVSHNIVTYLVIDCKLKSLVWNIAWLLIESIDIFIKFVNLRNYNQTQRMCFVFWRRVLACELKTEENTLLSTHCENIIAIAEERFENLRTFLLHLLPETDNGQFGTKGCESDDLCVWEQTMRNAILCNWA